MIVAAWTESFNRAKQRMFSPLSILSIAVLIVVILLMLPLKLPVGPMYWDLIVYIDGAHRVAIGQTPSVDFFAPVGPLAYWLVAPLLTTFSNAQPLLLVQWSLLLVSAPPMFVILAHVGQRSRATAFALLLPFLFFQLLPMNVEQYSSYPSVDGYGIYNRHTSVLLYILFCGLMFIRSQWSLFIVVTWTCLALFLLKITGFIAAGLLCAFAFVAGRMTMREVLGTVAAFLLALVTLDATLGVVRAYLADISLLVRLNEGNLLSRFLQASSLHFGILAPAATLSVALYLLKVGDSLLGQEPTGARAFGALARKLDRNSIWLAVAVIAGLFFETQNTGGQALILIWPVLLSVLLGVHRLSGASLILVLFLIGAAALPPFINVAHRVARALVVQVKFVDVPNEGLKTLGQVTQRPEIVERAAKMREVYTRFPETFQFLADSNLLPAFTLYSELDFQVGWLMAADEAVKSIREYELANKIQFKTIMNLNFVNPFPFLLNRDATRHIAIGADPSRAVPAPDAETLAAVSGTDLILYPTCPITDANDTLLAMYRSAMATHMPVVISKCWKGYIRPMK
ncbi:MAG: hypothetical protein B7Z08_10755 [Sphingomonadales bacterium 32-68-7]|nr:MAG: hypothetical protein B7Z08_10755 [Sphingomonadales bacterium 32-68-7]